MSEIISFTFQTVAFLLSIYVSLWIVSKLIGGLHKFKDLFTGSDKG